MMSATRAHAYLCSAHIGPTAPSSTLGRHTLPWLQAWGKARKQKLTHQARGNMGQMGHNWNQHNPPGNRRPHTKFQQVTPCLPNGMAPERRRPRTKQPHTSCDMVPRHRNPASRVTHKWPRNVEAHTKNAGCSKHVIATNKTEPLNNKPHFQGGPHTTPAKRRLALWKRE